MQNSLVLDALFGRKRKKMKMPVSIKKQKNHLRSTWYTTKAYLILALRGIITSKVSARVFSKGVIQKTFNKMIFDFFAGINQVALVQFCIFLFIKSFTNDIDYLRSIMVPILYNSRDLEQSRQLELSFGERRHTLFKSYIKHQFNLLKDLKETVIKVPEGKFLFELPNSGENRQKSRELQMFLSPSYLNNLKNYRSTVGKMADRIMLLFGIESAHLHRDFGKLFYLTFDLMVKKKMLLYHKNWKKKATYRSRYLQKAFVRRKRFLKSFSSRLMSSLNFYDK